VQRHIFVADPPTPEQNVRQARMERHLAHLNWLRAKHGAGATDTRFNVPAGADFETASPSAQCSRQPADRVGELESRWPSAHH